MSEIGYYRYKIIPTNVETLIQVYINGALACTHKVIAKDFCLEYRLIKYLDKNGQYRFFPFNDKWQETNTPTSKGTVNKFVESILNSQASERQIGYKNVKKITLVAPIVSSDELNKLSDIYTSPAVYLYVGNGLTDLKSDWIFITITGDGISRRKKAKYQKVTLEVTLPDQYEITKN